MTARKLKAWFKLGFVIAVVLAVVIFLVQNRETVEIDFLFWTMAKVPKFALVLSTAGLTLILYKVIGGLGRLVREVRTIMQENRESKEATAALQTETEERRDNE